MKNTYVIEHVVADLNTRDREREREWSKMVRKFIIDTDTGVDDAMALLMALDAHLKGEVKSHFRNT